jgi:anaerobic dimethyl sulfoxide reductase subunit B
MTYAFTFDASACTGCKACQIACKDKNGLPVGVLWRRVVEVSGGGWRRKGQAWESDVFAYSLSLACNHCVHPKCAGVCPVDAYTVRLDGIVLLDSSKCMGCGYCAWVCPYGAPQYNAQQGVMTKCNFCFDSLDAGLPPSCVAACPLRALDFAPVEEPLPTEGYLALWQLPAIEHPFPLPVYSRTEPHLSLKPHPATNNGLVKFVSNWEEILPNFHARFHRLPGFEEFPLIAFTLLSQMAVGMAVCMLALSSTSLPLLLVVGALLGMGGLVAFLHLGRKRNAWRALAHIQKSWLSREILRAGLFGAAWALTTLLAWFHTTSFVPWLTALLGLGLIDAMAQVYRIRAVPAWNTWRTPAAFFLSTAILGTLGLNLALPAPGWAAAGGLALTAEMGLALTAVPSVGGKAGRLRIALICLGVIGTLLMMILPQVFGSQLAIPIFGIVLVAEAIGRWQFYAQRLPNHF